MNQLYKYKIIQKIKILIGMILFKKILIKKKKYLKIYNY